MQHRRAQLAILALLPLLLGSGLIGGGGGGGGGGGPATDLTCVGCVSDGELASDYSGIGACTANKWVSTLNDNAAPTCTQPNFTDLAGTFAHSATTGLGNDDHTQYVLKTGRTGGQTIVGGINPSEGLSLQSTSDATRGSVYFNDSLRVVNDGGSLTFDPDATGAQNFIQYTDGTETVSNVWIAEQFTSGTYTINSNTAGIIGFNLASGMIMDYTAVTNPVFSSIASTFNASEEIRATGGATVAGFWATPYKAAITFNPTNASTVMGLTDAPDYDSVPIFKVTSSGAFGGTGRMGFHAKSTVSSGTVPQFRGFVYDDKTGAGTLSLQVGVDIAALGNATSNIGIRNADTTVFTSGATQSIASGGATQINCTATFIEIDYPTGGAVTDSNTPTVGDGSDGQVCIIVNVDSADTITLKDEAVTAGTNLRLPSHVNYAMAPRDTLTILYSSALGDWITIASSHN